MKCPMAKNYSHPDRYASFRQSAATTIPARGIRPLPGVRAVLCVVVLIAAAVSGCAAIRAGFDPTADFLALSSEPRVWYEPGADDLAALVASSLPGSIAEVEEELGGPFARPVEVYVCASERSFAALTNSPEDGRGAVVRSLFLSGRLMRPEYRETVDAVLKHELTHLHLMQRLGYFSFHGEVPLWFHEGLAEAISGGCGGMTVIEREAKQSILAGTKLVPDDHGGVFVLRDARSYGLERDMFYRQSGMFTGYLRRRDGSAFTGFVAALEQGGGFRRSFQKSFKMTVEAAWFAFEESLREELNSATAK